MTRYSIEDVLAKALESEKGDWRVYNRLKAEIARLWLPSQEYQEAIKRLAEILEV